MFVPYRLVSYRRTGPHRVVCIRCTYVLKGFSAGLGAFASCFRGALVGAYQAGVAGACRERLLQPRAPLPLPQPGVALPRLGFTGLALT